MTGSEGRFVVDGDVRRERARVLQAEADRRKELLANPPDTKALRWVAQGDTAYSRELVAAADWIDAVSDSEPKPASERVPLHKLRGRTLKGCGWPVATFSHRLEGDYVAHPDPGDDPAFAMFTEFAFTVDADGMVEVVK